jgi:16S rRNA (adenine(1408)-N(1))-methyltransferase
VVGVDANADNLRRASRRAAAAPARGGLPNLLFGRLALEHAPGALAGLADRLSILLPWGSLLRAVAVGEPDGLGRLRALCAPDAEIEIVLGDDDLDGVPAEALPARYADAGLAVSAEPVGAAEVAALGTTWAKRLARPDPERRFWRLSGRAVAPPLRPGSAPRTGS